MKPKLLFLFFAPVVWAQSGTPAFEAASIRPVGAAETPSGVTMDGARIRIGAFPLQPVILHAYGIKDYQLVGPAWLQTDRFVIEATLPRGATEEQVPGMLQGLLARRFQLKAHRASRVQNVYAIVVDRGGLKIPQVTGGGPAPAAEPPLYRSFSLALVQTNPGEFASTLAGGDLRVTQGPSGMQHIQASRISSLAELLSLGTGKPVVDRTDLTGSYKIEIDVTDERLDNLVSAATSPREGNLFPAAVPVDAGILKDALKGLGLNVETRREPVETLVIDSIEKTPSAN